jgi:hypothetical protein
MNRQDLAIRAVIILVLGSIFGACTVSFATTPNPDLEGVYNPCAYVMEGPTRAYEFA